MDMYPSEGTPKCGHGKVVLALLLRPRIAVNGLVIGVATRCKVGIFLSRFLLVLCFESGSLYVLQASLEHALLLPWPPEYKGWLARTVALSQIDLKYNFNRKIFHQGFHYSI